MDFWLGFEEKRAAAAVQNQMASPKKPAKPKPKGQKGSKSLFEKAKDYAPAAGAALAGLGAYKFMRKKPKNFTPATLVKDLDKGQKAPGKVRKWVDKTMHGVDDVHYLPHNKPTPKNPQKIKGRAIHTQDWHPEYVKGKNDVGDVSKSRLSQKIEGDKGYESRFIRKHSPKHAIPTKELSKSHAGKAGLSKLHKGYKGENYLVKPREGFASGVGGEEFLWSKDIQKFLSGEKLPAKKQKLVRQVMKNPKNFIAQKDLGIKKSPITRKPSEFRVHGVGGKVLPGATGIRGANIDDAVRSRGAEKHLQEFLDSLPENVRKENISWNADVARTKDGLKLIELNPGTYSSGLLDPEHLYKVHKSQGRIPALATSLNAARKNQNAYKTLTGGRTSQKGALTAALGTSGVSGAGAHVATDEG